MNAASGRGSDALRLFFALVPDAEVGEAVAALARDVALRTRGRAVPAPNLHLTLAFLGSVPASAVPALAAIGEALPRASFTLVLDRVGVFRSGGLAWLGAGDVPPALVAVHAALHAALAARGFAADPKPFRPHVTLARKCTAALRTPLKEPIRWRARAVALVASTPGPAGSSYRSLGTWTLEPGSGRTGDDLDA